MPGTGAPPAPPHPPREACGVFLRVVRWFLSRFENIYRASPLNSTNDVQLDGNVVQLSPRSPPCQLTASGLDALGPALLEIVDPETDCPPI